MRERQEEHTFDQVIWTPFYTDTYQEMTSFRELLWYEERW